MHHSVSAMEKDDLQTQIFDIYSSDFLKGEIKDKKVVDDIFYQTADDIFKGNDEEAAEFSDIDSTVINNEQTVSKLRNPRIGSNRSSFSNKSTYEQPEEISDLVRVDMQGSGGRTNLL